MFILTTLNSNYPTIWEKDGTAPFISTFEGKNVVARMNNILTENGLVFTVCVYRWAKSYQSTTPEAVGQNFNPSLVAITHAKLIPTYGKNKNDIHVQFSFLKKLSLESDKILRTIKVNPTPLIKEIKEEILLDAINLSKADLITLAQAARLY